MRKRKYYRAIVCKKSCIYKGSSYYYKEDVYAYSQENAIKLINLNHLEDYHNYIWVIAIKEIEKEQFRGQYVEDTDDIYTDKELSNVLDGYTKVREMMI